MKLLKLQKVLYLVLFTTFVGTACVSQQVSGSNDSKTSVSIMEQKMNNEEPSIFHFASNSDYVVIAVPTEVKPVGKRVKKIKEGELPNIADSVAGRVYSFQVEKQICSKQFFSLKNSGGQIPFNEFQIFVPFEAFAKESYVKGNRYLIFLEKIPEKDNLNGIYELENDTNYFRAFDGKSISVFPYEGGMHGPPTKGIIDLSKPERQELIQRIETLCLALNEPNTSQRVRSLQKLTESPDEIIRANAIFALEFVRSLEREN